MKNRFEIIQDAPYCSNCGESEWKKTKNGSICCVYCGYVMTNTQSQNKDNFKNNLKKILDKRR